MLELGRLAARLFAAALLILGTVAIAPVRAQLNTGPMIRLQERRWDLGQIPQGGRFTHIFKLVNQGTADLAIKKLETSCGCTAALASDSLLAPNEASEIEITFSSKDFEGEQTKFVAVFTNDPAEPRVDLVLHAFVRPFVRVEERLLDFGPVRRGEQGFVSTVLRADKASGFKLDKVGGAEDYVDWKIVPISEPDSLAYRIEGRLKPTAALGRFNERVDLRLTHPNKESDYVSVRGLVYSYFQPEKFVVTFNTVKTGKDQERSIEIKADGSKPFRLTDAVASAPYLSTKLSPLGSGYKLTVFLDVPQEERKYQDRVTVMTTDPDQPTIEILVNTTIRR